MARRGAPVQPDVDDPPPGKRRAKKTGNADVDAAIALLEWGRVRGYRIGPQITIGGAAFMVADLRLMKREALVDPADQDDDDDEPDDIFAEHGGPTDAPAEGTTG